MNNEHEEIAENLKEDFVNKKNFDFSNEEPKLSVNPSITLEEHEGTPRSYMVFNNLKTIVADSCELLSIMNEHDELPAWTQEMISIAKYNVAKALDYVRAEKTEE